MFLSLSLSLSLAKVWSTRYIGMWGDDVAKMPHMARIAGSVYPDISAEDYYMSRDKVGCWGGEGGSPLPSPNTRHNPRMCGWVVGCSVHFLALLF